MSQILKILFQTGDIIFFVLYGVFFSRYVQLKSSFSDKENISGEIQYMPLTLHVVHAFNPIQDAGGGGGSVVTSANVGINPFVTLV